MATAMSWEAAKGLPPEIATIMGPNAELLLAIPEHKVPLPGGQRESQCDVFALIKVRGKTYALAVEAKVNETFGPTIEEWMQNPTTRRIERLTYICALLGVSYPPPPELRYQLFHRTASAVIEASRFQTDAAAMIVQSFSQDNKWFEDFEAFCQYLGGQAVLGKGFDCLLTDGRNLTLGWATGSKEFL